MELYSWGNKLDFGETIEADQQHINKSREFALDYHIITVANEEIEICFKEKEISYVGWGLSSDDSRLLSKIQNYSFCLFHEPGSPAKR